MQKFLALIILSVLFLGTTTTTFAAPWMKAQKQLTPNDKIVAYYPDGRHAIPGDDNDQYYGRDLVVRRGHSDQFQQWFEGYNPYGDYVGIHTVWNLSRNGDCPDNTLAIPDAYPQWGDYLVPGATYCIHNNYYDWTK